MDDVEVPLFLETSIYIYTSNCPTFKPQTALIDETHVIIEMAYFPRHALTPQIDRSIRRPFLLLAKGVIFVQKIPMSLTLLSSFLAEHFVMTAARSFVQEKPGDPSLFWGGRG